MNKAKEIIIVGSGLGGLSTGLRLASRGYKIKILEKNSNAGGRLNRFSENGFTFDVGPSFMSMTYEFDELFRFCNIDNPLKLQKLDPLYTVNFSGSTKKYNIWNSIEKLAQEFRHIEPDFLVKCEEYLNLAGEFYKDTETNVIKANFNNYFDYLVKISRVPLKHLPYLKKNLWSLLDNTFDSKEVKIIFSLIAFFLGSTPFKTPSIFSILNYTELKHNGYWAVEGGMYNIVSEILNSLNKLNAEVIYDTEISDVSNVNGKLKSIKDTAGREWKADAFIINSDAASFRGKVLNRKKYSAAKLDKMNWSLAPFTVYLGIKGKIKELNYHNYFLGNDFTEYAGRILTSGSVDTKPYYYVNMPSYLDQSCAPEGCENIFVLCPVPDLRYKKDWSDREEIFENIIKDLSERIRFDLKSNILVKRIYTPVEWESMFNLYRGSGLGLSHDLMQVGALRPSNKDEEYSNLYYVGASTIPGTGLPMVLISSRLVTERIINEY